ncbi:MAG: peptide deformylase [Candidatus Promineifilaceae bacterium]|nr:peptide deformylase [Candidatus Promineifilaceae bacterium]
MTILEIEQLNNPILRQKARPVTSFDDDLQQLIDDMIETMREANGAGLAGPQVNQRLRLTVVETPPEYDDEGEEIEGSRELLVLVNPEIVWTSHEMVDGIEGCLSIPGFLGEVERYEAIRVRAQDRRGRKIRLRLKDWAARIVQHEIDHLDGVLYIDRLTAPENFWREEDFLAAAEEESQEGATSDGPTQSQDDVDQRTDQIPVG